MRKKEIIRIVRDVENENIELRRKLRELLDAVFVYVPSEAGSLNYPGLGEMPMEKTAVSDLLRQLLDYLGLEFVRAPSRIKLKSVNLKYSGNKG